MGARGGENARLVGALSPPFHWRLCERSPVTAWQGMSVQRPCRRPPLNHFPRAWHLLTTRRWVTACALFHSFASLWLWQDEVAAAGGAGAGSSSSGGGGAGAAAGGGAGAAAGGGGGHGRFLHYSPDPAGQRTGDAPSPELAEVLNRTCDEAAAVIAKAQVDRGVCLTQAMIQEKVDNIRGAVTMGACMDGVQAHVCMYVCVPCGFGWVRVWRSGCGCGRVGGAGLMVLGWCCAKQRPEFRVCW
jgi:hypothetical protein